MRVLVDISRCQGHARCEDICPEAFATDAVEGKCVIADPQVPPGLEDKVRLVCLCIFVYFFLSLAHCMANRGEGLEESLAIITGVICPSTRPPTD